MNKVTRIKNENFTIISNVFLQDKQLSLKAKGFLAVIMGLKDDWDFSINGICSILKEGKTSVYHTINELKDYGYCQVDICRDDKGAFIGNDYKFYEEPQPEKPHTVLPHTETPHTDNQPQLNTNIINKETNKKLTKEDTKVSKKAKVNWRGDYDIYLQECKKAFDEVVRDAECEKSLMVSYPNIDYYRTVLKSYEFWKSERGWDYKKRGTSVSINMASTLKRNLEKNIVYENPNNVHIENKLKLTLKIVDDKGTLEDGTVFKNGYRYYKSGNGKEYSVPVTAPARPDERWEYSIDNGWYLPESKETLDDLLW